MVLIRDGSKLMNYRTRKTIKSEDLNGHNTLFGGRLLEWIDEECFIFCCCQLDTIDIVTKYMSEINFVSAGHLGSIIEIGVETVAVGTTSLTVRCTVRNKINKETLIDINKIMFVSVNKDGTPVPHRLAKHKDEKVLSEPEQI